jgi:chromosome segregation ATPase
LTQKVAALQQTQQQRQDMIGGMEENINALAASISGLGQDVLRLQELLQSNIRELVSIAEVAGQKQAEFQESMGTNLQMLDDSFASLKANQNKLQSRIEQSYGLLAEMQNNTPDLSGMPLAMDQLRNQLDDSLASLKASQDKLQNQIDQMQNDTPDLRDIPSALDQLRDQLEELSRSQMSADDIGMIEYEASADISDQTGNIE